MARTRAKAGRHSEGKTASAEAWIAIAHIAFSPAQAWGTLFVRQDPKRRSVDRTMAKRNGLPVSCILSIALLASVSSGASAEPAKDIVVFDFEMMESSASAGNIPQDELDTKYLAESTQIAKNHLLSTGAYSIVNAEPAAMEIAKVGELRRCNGCEAAIASKLGGELAMTGVVNRISRTEYEMLIKVVDAGTGATVVAGYTGLRMGANYSWPRGAKWLMEKRVLANLPNE
jgi:Protein of unknown function (DUF2380)